MTERSGDQKFWFDGLPVQGLFVEYDLVPGAGDLIFTTFVPGLLVSEHSIISVPKIDLNFSTFVPEVVQNHIIVPITCNLILSISPPAISGNHLTPDSTSLNFSTFVPEMQVTNFVSEIIRSIKIPGNTGSEIILIEIDLWQS